MKYSLLLLSFLTIHCATYQTKKAIPAQKNNIPFENKKDTGLKGETLPPGVFIIPNKKNIPSAQTLAPFENKKQEEDRGKAETQCNDSGVTVFPEEKVFIGLKSRKLSKRVFKILEREKKRNLKHCQKNCQQKNTYKAFIQIAPIFSTPYSCPLSESKEIYAFQKTFALQENSKNLKTGGKQSEPPPLNSKKTKEKLKRQMEEWILRTFVYPYTPGVRFTPTKELLSHKIDKACPKCSFYFDYSYFFESDNQLNLDITVRCGDRKKGIGFTRMAKLQIKNQWQCSAKKNQ